MKKGFTLIELIVVIAIIAILAAIIAPNAFKAIEKAKVTKVIGDLNAIKKAITAQYADTHKFPNGCLAFKQADPEVYFDPSIYGGEDRAGLIQRPPVRVAGWQCEWTQTDIDAWDGPYLENSNVRDPWKSSYLFDPDYAFCLEAAYPQVAACPATSTFSVSEECKKACGGNLNCAPPVITSVGPDKTFYTCDDIVMKMTLN